MWWCLDTVLRMFGAGWAGEGSHARISEVDTDRDIAFKFDW